MSNEFSQYKDLYVQTSKEYLQELNKALLKLEKDPQEKTAVEDIFRSAHSLKSQSAAMEFNSTAYLCHTIEDVFYEIKEGRLKMNSEIADILFKSFDSLTKAVTKIETEGNEVDQKLLIEKLKKITGVATEGVGKSVRNTPKAASESTTKTPERTVPVKISILDDLMNLVEELLISKVNFPELKNYFVANQKILESLQYKVMQARAIKVGVVLEHFPRMIRDLARDEKKEVELKMSGEDLELDRTIVDRLDEPLVHILRNAVSHGIDKKGVIIIEAKSEKDYAVISIEDNGKGIDWEKLAKKAGQELKEITPSKLKELLFLGVSTTDKVTEISGRGVGMKVVKKMVADFGGEIEVESNPGAGTKISLKIPLTLAIVKSVMVTIKGQDYAIPALQIERIINLEPELVKETADQKVFVLNETEIPIVTIDKTRPEMKEKTIVVVVKAGNEKIGLVVDGISQTEDVVVKELPKSLNDLKSFSGTTITNLGRPALVINTQGLL